MKAIAIIQSYKHLAYYQTKKKTKGKKKNHDMKSKFSSFFYQWKRVDQTNNWIFSNYIYISIVENDDLLPNLESRPTIIILRHWISRLIRWSIVYDGRWNSMNDNHGLMRGHIQDAWFYLTQEISIPLLHHQCKVFKLDLYYVHNMRWRKK